MHSSPLVRHPGCADGTQETIKKALAGIPGKLLSENFVDFSTTRNWALRVRFPSPMSFTAIARQSVLWRSAHACKPRQGNPCCEQTGVRETVHMVAEHSLAAGGRSVQSSSQ